MNSFGDFTVQFITWIFLEAVPIILHTSVVQTLKIDCWLIIYCTPKAYAPLGAKNSIWDCSEHFLCKKCLHLPSIPVSLPPSITLCPIVASLIRRGDSSVAQSCGKSKNQKAKLNRNSMSILCGSLKIDSHLIYVVYLVQTLKNRITFIIKFLI